MTIVSVQKLKQQTKKSEPVKWVKNKKITRAWARLALLAVKVGKKWQENISAEEAISQDRR